jgi:hypothetical protein
LRPSQPKAASIEILIPPYSILEALAAAAVRNRRRAATLPFAAAVLSYQKNIE